MDGNSQLHTEVTEAAVDEEEAYLSRHRKEKKELQAEIQRLKHGIPKGDKKKKKEVTAQIAVLDAELDARHENEIEELRARLSSVHLVNDVDNTLSVSDGQLAGDMEENPDDVKRTEKKPSKTQRRKDKKAQKRLERDEQIRDQELINESGVRSFEAGKIKASLRARGLAVHEIPSDGNCLYAAIVDQLKQRQILSSVESLRRQTAEYLRRHPDDFLPFLVKDSGDMYSPEEFTTYCEKLESTSEWGGHVEICALSDVLGSSIEVIQADGPSVMVGEGLPGHPLTLSYHRHAYGLGEHYNSVVRATGDTEEGEDGFS